MTLTGAGAMIRTLMTLGIVAFLLAVVAGDAAAALPDPADTEVHVSVSCLNDRGRIDVQIVNGAESSQSYQLQVDRERRDAVINGRGIGRLTVTNEFDPAVDVRLTSTGPEGETELFSQTFELACADPAGAADQDGAPVSGPEVTAVQACGGGGLVELRMTNPTASPRSYIIELTDPEGAVSRSSTTATGYGIAFRRLSNLADGPHTIAVISPGRGVIDTREIKVVCRQPLAVRAHNVIDNDANGGSTKLALNAEGHPVIAYDGNSTTIQLSWGNAPPKRPAPRDLRRSRLPVGELAKCDPHRQPR